MFRGENELNVSGSECLENSPDLSGLSSLSDEDLAGLCQTDRNAISVLMSRYIRLIWKRALSFSENYPDAEDLFQEGLLALLKATSTFDKSRGAKFSSYCDVCVTNRIRNAVRATPDADKSISTDDIDEPDNVTPEVICLEKESEKEINVKLSTLLSESEWSIFSLFLDDLSYKEISDKLGISVKAVDNGIFRVRKKLKALLGSS